MLKRFSISIIIVLFVVISISTVYGYTSKYTEPTTIIKLNSTGTGVKWVQDMLNQYGYSLVVDGVFGSNTYSAVKSFQKSKGLEVDGIVGKDTRNALKIGLKSITTVVNSNKYTTANVNFRNGPSTSSYSYLVIPNGTLVYVYQVRSDGWAYIKYNNTNGYVYNEYLSYTKNTVNNESNLIGLQAFSRTSTSLTQIIKNCKSYLATNKFIYSLASGARTIPADKSKLYNGNYCIDCSSYVSWVLYEYALANGKTDMKNYFSYQRSSSTFAEIGANGGNSYLSVVSKKDSSCVDLSKARFGDILVSNGHVEFFSSYTQNGSSVSIKVYNCGSNNSIKYSGVTTSATTNINDITYILRVR